MIFWASAAITNATWTNLFQIATEVKSDTPSMLGAGKRNRRLTLSSGHGRFLSGIVVPAARPGSFLEHPCSASVWPAGNVEGLTAKLPTDLAEAADLHVRIEDALDLGSRLCMRPDTA